MSEIIKGWRHNDQRYNLIGTKCKTCDETFFPKRVVCPNCRSHERHRALWLYFKENKQLLTNNKPTPYKTNLFIT